MGGSGQVHVWGKVVYTASGNTLSGTLQACGIALPPTTLSALGGGGMIQIEVPNAAWDAPSMPRFQVDGTQTGWNVGSTLSFSYAALVGFTIANPTTAAWPASYTGITMTNDAEGDTHVGLTAVPRSGGGFTLPPTSILQTSRADQLYIVVRQVTSATLTRTACDQASGSATFAHFNNHVVGCHVMRWRRLHAERDQLRRSEPHDLPGHERDRPDQGRRGHRHLCRRARRAARCR